MLVESCLHLPTSASLPGALHIAIGNEPDRSGVHAATTSELLGATSVVISWRQLSSKISKHLISYTLSLIINLCLSVAPFVRESDVPDKHCPLLFAYTFCTSYSSYCMYTYKPERSAGWFWWHSFCGPMATLRIESLMSSKPFELRFQKHRPSETYN